MASSIWTNLCTRMGPSTEARSGLLVAPQRLKTCWVCVTATASRYGSTELNTRVTGRTTERTVRGVSGMQTATNLKVILSMINRMETELTRAWTGQSTQACGSTMLSTGKARHPGLMAAHLSAITKKERKMELVAISGPRATNTKANGKTT